MVNAHISRKRYKIETYLDLSKSTIIPNDLDDHFSCLKAFQIQYFVKLHTVTWEHIASYGFQWYLRFLYYYSLIKFSTTLHKIISDANKFRVFIVLSHNCLCLTENVKTLNIFCLLCNSCIVTSLQVIENTSGHHFQALSPCSSSFMSNTKSKLLLLVKLSMNSRNDLVYPHDISVLSAEKLRLIVPGFLH